MPPSTPAKPAPQRDVLDVLLRSARPAHVPAGSPLFESGDPPRLAVVLAGLVRVSMLVPGGRPVTLRYATQGEIIGLVPTLAGADSFAAEAVTDSSLAMLSLDGLRRRATAEPTLAWELTEAIARCCADALQGMAWSGLASTRTRLAAHLLAALRATPDGSLVAHVTHQQLADAVGTAREVVSRTLGELRQLDVLSTERGRVVVHDHAALSGIAAQGDSD
jgi:CRP/FNR family transcriptional regulator, cyclic AMP receptor protein